MGNLIQIILKPLFHRGQQCIGIYFEKNATVQNIIQKDAGAKWSRTNRCWWIPCKRNNYLLLKDSIGDKASIIAEELKGFFKEDKELDTIPSSDPPTKMDTKPIVRKGGQTFSKNISPHNYPHTLSKENKEAFEEFTRQLTLKGYSPSTIRTYTNEFMQFLNTIRDNAATGFDVSRLKDYFQYCHKSLKLSEATIHSRINALKFYYEQVLGREKFFWEIPRPKKPNQLPRVLSENEIGRMFNALTNIKHKAILFTAYSAGLRVSEVINLKIRDVDSDRMQLFIEKSKGKKDRYVGLGILLLDVLRAYLKSCRPMPVKYVFENPDNPGQRYSVRSAQQIFHNAKEKAKINKNVGIHSLRHSFATHLLEKGIDIRYIKDILGHLSIKTTEKYLHVKKETLINIPNVLDELNKNITLDW